MFDDTYLSEINNTERTKRKLQGILRYRVVQSSRANSGFRRCKVFVKFCFSDTVAGINNFIMGGGFCTGSNSTHFVIYTVRPLRLMRVNTKL